MINRINTLRTVANNLKSHLCMVVKEAKITKPGALVPGAAAVSGVVMTLETTKDNNANLIVKKDGAEIQKAEFNYKETNNEYELVSAMSAFLYDDKDNKELQQNIYSIKPEKEEIYEHSVNYTNAPIKETTREYIDKINSSVAQISGYKSGKTDYDPQESHTYGKKSLQRDIPALLKLLDIIAPNAEFTLKMKDKLKKDNKTSLVAFEVNNTENGNGIVKGFLASNGDSISYHIDTENMTVIGEKSPNKDLSRAYLKPEKTETEQKEIKEDKKNETSKEVSNHKNSTQTAITDTSKNEIEKDGKRGVKKKVPAKKQTQTAAEESKHVYPKEHYTNLILEAATDENLPPQKKVKIYKEVLAQAYSDGYSKAELENILTGNGLIKFSYYCKRAYVEAGIKSAGEADVKQAPVNTLDDKIKELLNIKIDIDDEALQSCIISMINDIAKINDDDIKQASVDKALNLLKNNSSPSFKSDLLSFIQESGEINDDLKLHYEIYIESVNDKKKKVLQSKIEKMINNISDANHHEKRNEFLTQLYTVKSIVELQQLQDRVQTLLDGQTPLQTVEEMPKKEEPIKLSLDSLSNRNQNLVRELRRKRPREMALSLKEAKNLLLNIGFKEINDVGSHHKFRAPIEIFIKGRKQTTLTIADTDSKSIDAGAINDIINICKQYYGNEN